MESGTRKLIWDFFGPNAAGTAAHFLKHLEQFLQANGASGTETGSAAAGPGHTLVYCVATTEIAPGIERALKPRRSE